jgi:hypothetical protein
VIIVSFIKFHFSFSFLFLGFVPFCNYIIHAMRIKINRFCDLFTNSLQLGLRKFTENARETHSSCVFVIGRIFARIRTYCVLLYEKIKQKSKVRY